MITIKFDNSQVKEFARFLLVLKDNNIEVTIESVIGGWMLTF